MNVIDVIATAPRRLPTMTALRVTRDVLVTVPALEGVLEDEVEARLEPLGLAVDVERGGGLFDVLRAGEPRVCEQEPERRDAGAARAARCSWWWRSAAERCAQLRGVTAMSAIRVRPRVAHDAEHDLALDRGAGCAAHAVVRRSRGRRRRRSPRGPRARSCCVAFSRNCVSYCVTTPAPAAHGALRQDASHVAREQPAEGAAVLGLVGVGEGLGDGAHLALGERPGLRGGDVALVAVEHERGRR